MVCKEATHQLIEAQNAAALKKLEVDKASGAISQKDYERGKAAIEDTVSKAKSSVDAAALAKEIRDRRAALAQVKKEEEEAKKQADAGNAAMTGPGGMARTARIEQLKHQQAEANRLAEEAKGKLAKAQEEATQAQEEIHFPSMGQTAENLLGLGIWYPGTRRAQQNALNKETEAQRLEKQQREQTVLAQKSDDEAARLNDAEAKDKALVQEAQKRAETLRQQAQSQETALKNLGVQQTIKTQGEMAGKLFKRFSDVSQTPVGQIATKDVESADRTAQALEQHKQVSEESKKQLVDIASAVAGHQLSLQQAVQQMGAAAADMGKFSYSVLALANTMQQIAQAQAQSRTELDAKLSFVAKQVNQLMHRRPLQNLPGEG